MARDFCVVPFICFVVFFFAIIGFLVNHLLAGNLLYFIIVSFATVALNRGFMLQIWSVATLVDVVYFSCIAVLSSCDLRF